MTTTTYDARPDGRRHVAAAQLEPGDEVYLDGQTRLVARVVASREDVMVELWSRGAVEHSARFLDHGHLVAMVVAQ